MNMPRIFITAVFSTLLVSNAAIATVSVNPDTANSYLDSNWRTVNPEQHSRQGAPATTRDIAFRYLDTNWTLTTTGDQPRQTQDSHIDDLSTRYFDANWAVIQSGGRPAE